MGNLNFCTYFDKNYLLKGLAMYRSLERYLKSFSMWILCFDDLTYEVLKKLELKNVRLISLREFESGDEDLARAKLNRTLKEYLWTVTPTLCLFVLKNNPEIKSITYLDADLLFFKEPCPIYDQFDGSSILIIGHRYFQKYAYLEPLHGIYNVAMLVFRNDKQGHKCLSWWRERCNEWCFCRMEDGKFGDQKYLDDWPVRFEGVVVLGHKGANLAPWNIDNYALSKVDGKVMVDEEELIFFHYHSTSQVRDDAIEAPQGYKITKQYLDLIYRPYLKSLCDALSGVRRVYPYFRCGIEKTNTFRMAKKLLSGRLCC